MIGNGSLGSNTPNSTTLNGKPEKKSFVYEVKRPIEKNGDEYIFNYSVYASGKVKHLFKEFKSTAVSAVEAEKELLKKIKEDTKFDEILEIKDSYPSRYPGDLGVD